MCYIYEIRNIQNNKIYIGSTKNFNKRKNEHLRHLRKNIHCNQYLQKSFNKYGEQNFIFSILEECSYEYLLNKEQEWIDKLKPEYNIGAVGGGDNYTNHPRKEEIKLRLIEILRQSKRPEPLRKEKNPNWKGGITFFICPKCKKEIRVTGERKKQKSCKDCKDVFGKNNPMYNKKHSKETKNKISNSKLGKASPNSKKCSINNVIYRSIREASIVLKIDCRTIKKRILSEDTKFNNWFFI